MNELLHIVGTEQFQTEVLDFDGVVVVDFYADWCGPCRMLWPVMEALSQDNANKPVKIVKVNVDENQELSSQFEVQGIPAVFIINKWQTVANFVGVQPQSMYQEKINEYLSESDWELKMAA